MPPNVFLKKHMSDHVRADTPYNVCSVISVIRRRIDATSNF